MKRFKNILAVYNNAVGDDDALTQATALAERNDARLTVIEVVKDAGASDLPPLNRSTLDVREGAL